MKYSRSLAFARRHFVRNAGIGLAGLAFQPLVPRLLAKPRLGSSVEPRVLVVIHLQGGHDGHSWRGFCRLAARGQKGAGVMAEHLVYPHEPSIDSDDLA
jgi:hypothetical protein